MATKATKKPQSLGAQNKDFMANFSYDRMNPPAPVRTGSLAARPPVPTTAQPSQMSNTDVVDTFNGLRQQAIPQGYKRPVTRRGMSGQELDANGKDPGSGMAWFDANNSPAQVDARNARQGVLDQRRGNEMAAAGASAVAERKALQEMGQAPFQLQEANRNANSVKGNDEYMTLFDGKGNAVGTNRPPAQKTNWAAQNAAYPNQVGPALSSTNPKNPNLQAQIQQGFNQDAQQPRPMGPPKPASNFLDSYATPGGNTASVVGAPSAPGTPVGGNPPQAPKPAPAQPPTGPAADWASLLDNSGGPDIRGFEEQIQQMQQSQQVPPAPYSDPFVGAPYGGKLNAAQNEVLSLFAPKETGFLGKPTNSGKVVSGNTNALNTILPGRPGQNFWPMLDNQAIQSFGQFFPGMQWPSDRKDSSRSRVQQNFDDLIKQNAIRVGPDGNYQIVPQYPMEQLMQQY